MCCLCWNHIKENWILNSIHIEIMMNRHLITSCMRVCLLSKSIMILFVSCQVMWNFITVVNICPFITINLMRTPSLYPVFGWHCAFFSIEWLILYSFISDYIKLDVHWKSRPENCLFKSKPVYPIRVFKILKPVHVSSTMLAHQKYFKYSTETRKWHYGMW